MQGRAPVGAPVKLDAIMTLNRDHFAAVHQPAVLNLKIKTRYAIVLSPARGREGRDDYHQKPADRLAHEMPGFWRGFLWRPKYHNVHWPTRKPARDEDRSPDIPPIPPKKIAASTRCELNWLFGYRGLEPSGSGFSAYNNKNWEDAMKRQNLLRSMASVMAVTAGLAWSGSSNAEI